MAWSVSSSCGLILVKSKMILFEVYENDALNFLQVVGLILTLIFKAWPEFNNTHGVAILSKLKPLLLIVFNTKSKLDWVSRLINLLGSIVIKLGLG